jgi:hypothetical protein
VDGRLLVTRDDQPQSLYVRPPGAIGLQDYSWLDGSFGPILSDDGELLAFSDQSVFGGSQYAVTIRKTDGSPAVRIGEGMPVAISRDKRWVLGTLPTAPPEYRLYPVGAGEPRSLAWVGLESVASVAFFPDSRSLFVCGNERDRAPRCYRSPLDASALEPVTPDSVGNGLLRPDGRAVAVSRSDGWWVYPLDGGLPVRVPGLDDAIVLRWSPDGTALWVQSEAGPDAHLDRVDLASGRRTPLLTVETPSDASIFAILNVAVADDPGVYVFSARSYRSALFTIEGVR